MDQKGLDSQLMSPSSDKCGQINGVVVIISVGINVDGDVNGH